MPTKDIRPTMPALPEGRLVPDVTVTHVDKPDLVWLSAAPTPESERLLQQVDALELTEVAVGVVEGSLAAVRFSEDGLVYRARVLQAQGPNLLVRFIDFGNTEMKTPKELYKLPAALAAVPGLAVEVQVAGAEGTKDSSKNRDRVAAKLGKAGLEVVLTATAGGLRGQFSYNGKVIAFSKKKDGEGEKKAESIAELPKEEVKEAKKDVIEARVVVEEVRVEVEEVKVEEVRVEVEEAKAPAPLMFSCLPGLALLEGVRTSGAVMYVAPAGQVWFSPQWAQDKLAEVTEVMDALGPGQLVAAAPVEGMLCLARSEDTCLYRARVTGLQSGKQDAWVAGRPAGAVTVEFFDYGNTEAVAEVLEYPACLGTELAPAAAEVVLARTVRAQGRDKVALLEACLMGEDRSLELLLEKDKDTGMKVARFFEDGEEVIFDNKIEAAKVFDKEREVEAAAEDVVVELLEEVKAPKVIKIVEAAASPPAKEQKAAPVAAQEASVALVPGRAMPGSGVVAVEVVLVEATSRVWVTRAEDLPKVEKMMAALEKMAGRLAAVAAPVRGCVYGARFSEDDVMYRAVVEEVACATVTVRFVDYGNTEVKERGELVHLTDKMARWGAAAVAVDLVDNIEAEDSQEHRDQVEAALDGRLELVFEQGNLVEVRREGRKVEFEFNKKKEPVMTKQKVAEPEVKKNVKPDKEAEVVAKSDEKKQVIKPVEKKESPKVVEKMESVKKVERTAEANKSPAKVSPAKSSSADTNLNTSEALVSMRDALPTVRETGRKEEVKPVAEKVKEVAKDAVIVAKPSKPQTEPTKETAPPSLAKPAEALKPEEKVVPAARPKHGAQSTYVPPARRGAAPPATMEVCRRTVGEVTSEVAALKAMLEKELPRAAERPGVDGEERPSQPAGSRKVNDWLERNEAARNLEAGLPTDPLEQSTPLSSSSPLFTGPAKAEGAAAAREGLARILSRAPYTPTTLMTMREHSEALQRLIPLLAPPDLQPLVAAARDNLRALAVDSSGTRVVQALLEYTAGEQRQQLLRLLGVPATILLLATDKFGTYVAQAGLGLLATTAPALLAIVRALKGKTGELGCTPHGTFFLQRLVEVVGEGGKGVAILLHEDVLASIGGLAFSEAGTRVVQAVVRAGTMASVVRAARWLELHMDEVVTSSPGVFTALSVVERLVAAAGGAPEWSVVLDLLAASLLDTDATGRPLLVTAALHPQGHLLAREVVARANLLPTSRPRLLCALQQHLHLLRHNKTGDAVLLALQGVLS